MSVPQKPEFILIVNQENKDAIAAALPGIAFAQVLAYDIGIVDRVILSAPRPAQAPAAPDAPAEAPASDEVPMPESLEKAIDEAVELPVEDLDVVPAE